MTSARLQQRESSVGWELRGALASRRVVRLVLSDCCDGIRPNSEGVRVLEGLVSRVAATDAYCVIQGRHVPLWAVAAVRRPHWSLAPASDPAEPWVQAR